MGAFENAKAFSKEEVLSKIAALGITGTGLCRDSLADILAAGAAESAEEGKDLGVVVALNNADTDKALLGILTAAPEKVFAGAAIAAYAIGAKKIQLNVPEENAALVEEYKELADKYGVNVESGIVNVRAVKGSALVHIATAADLTDAFDGGYEAGVYVSVNGGEVKKVAPDTKIADLADTAEATALIVGYCVYGPDAAQKTVAEVVPENGVIRVLTKAQCVIAETDKLLSASKAQSCGKCVFCREGLIQLQYMTGEIIKGKGKNDFVDFTKEIGSAMTFSTPCTMGQNCSRIALSAVEKFADVYDAHIKKKKCDVCFSKEAVYIDPMACTGCGDCEDECPKGAIMGKPRYIYMIDSIDCDACGKCIAACDEGCIIKTSDKLPKLPDKLTKVGRFKKR